MLVGLGVAVAVAVLVLWSVVVGVCVAEGGIEVDDGLGVRVEVDWLVADGGGVWVGVGDKVADGDGVGVAVNDGRPVADAVAVCVAVAVAEQGCKAELLFRGEGDAA